MAQIDLYINLATGGLEAPLPALTQGDSPTLRIWLLQPSVTGSFQVPSNSLSRFNLLPTAGLTLQVAIGDKVGNTTNYYTQQFAWTANPSADALLQYWTALLPLNTAAITTLIAGNAQANSTLHVLYVSGGLPTTVLELGVTIQAAVIKGGAVVVPPGQTALSAEVALGLFLQRTVQGQIVFVSPDGSKKMAFYLGNDGVLHEDPQN